MNRDTFDHFQQAERGLFGDNEAAPARTPRVTGASDVIDLTLFLHAESQKGKKELGAIRVSALGDDDKGKWLAKSLVEFELTGKRERSKQGQGCEIVIVTLPEWLAEREGLI